MSAIIIALITGIPAILASITALIQATKAKNSAIVAQSTAVHANNAINDHVVYQHNAFPIQPPSSQEPQIQ